MSVSVFRMNRGNESFELRFEIPVAREEFFTKFWQTAISELKIKRIRNGIELKKEDLQFILEELAQLRNWAEHNLQDNDLDYMLSRINLLIKELPLAFKTEDTTLWMG